MDYMLENRSMVYVTEDAFQTEFTLATFFKRDFDTIPESLGNQIDNMSTNSVNTIRFFFFFNSGEVSNRFYILSISHIPIRIRKKIDKLTSVIMESGIHEHFQSLKVFDQTMDGLIKPEFHAVLEPITIEEMIRPMILICGLWIASILVFIKEIIVHKWIIWRNRRHEAKSQQEPTCLGRDEIARKYFFSRLMTLKRLNRKSFKILREKNSKPKYSFRRPFTIKRSVMMSLNTDLTD